jgi:hypothetical protein
MLRFDEAGALSVTGEASEGRFIGAYGGTYIRRVRVCD